MLDRLADVGLGYLTLGQMLNTPSGSERLVWLADRRDASGLADQAAWMRLATPVWARPGR